MMQISNWTKPKGRRSTSRIGEFYVTLTVVQELCSGLRCHYLLYSCRHFLRMHSFLCAMFPMAELFAVRAAQIAVNIRSPCGCDTSQQSVDLSVFNLSASFVYRTHVHTFPSFSVFIRLFSCLSFYIPSMLFPSSDASASVTLCRRLSPLSSFCCNVKWK